MPNRSSRRSQMAERRTSRKKQAPAQPPAPGPPGLSGRQLVVAFAAGGLLVGTSILAFSMAQDELDGPAAADETDVGAALVSNSSDPERSESARRAAAQASDGHEMSQAELRRYLNMAQQMNQQNRSPMFGAPGLSPGGGFGAPSAPAFAQPPMPTGLGRLP